MYAYGSSEFPPIYSVYFVTMIDIFRVCSHNQIYLTINQFLSYIWNTYMKYWSIYICTVILIGSVIVF
jgi:hypothetical protein